MAENNAMAENKPKPASKQSQQPKAERVIKTPQKVANSKGSSKKK
ncbi:MAG: hypothetical protein ABSB91_01050 [Sedimentisphaerales bacterium]|jgi:hypothetical protein